jgi:hypothetical protein
MNILKSIPEDGTSSHNIAGTTLKAMTSVEHMTCYDLTAATDRMPIDLQIKVFLPIFGEEITSLWKNLMTNRDIGYRDKTIRYAVGQPMGILSSWAAMALTHHVIIQYSKIKAGLPAKYLIIGDDMTISNTKVAKVYSDTLEKLGMEISLGKSLIPNTSKAKVGEIAKRYFIEGQEISPIPPQILAKSTGSLNGFLEMEQVMRDRDYSRIDPGELQDDQVLKQLFYKSKLKIDHNATAFLTFPGTRPPLSWVRSVWEGYTVEFLHAEYNKFLYGICFKKVKRLNMQIMEENKRKMTLSISPNDPNYEYMKSLIAPIKREYYYSPIIEMYMKLSSRELQGVIAEIGTPLMKAKMQSKNPETGLVDYVSSLSIMEDLLSRPEPEDIAYFSSKRALRVNKLSSLLSEFHLKLAEKAEGGSF